MYRAWNGKRLLNDCTPGLTDEQRALAVIANCLEDLKREFVPTSSINREVTRIQEIALQRLYPVMQGSIINKGCGTYRLMDCEE